MTLLIALAIVWVTCGVVAFGTYVVRRRGYFGGGWLELPVQLVAAALLGVVALVGVFTNDEYES